jgi:hypothetical protein
LGGVAIRMEILRLSLDVEPLPHEGFRPGELRMNEQAKIPQSSINKKTQQTEQRGTSQTELKARKYLALLVALFPHCLITPRNNTPQQWKKNDAPSTLPPRLLTRQGASLEEANLKSRRNFASQSKILTREPRILDRIDCRAKCFSLPQQNQPRRGSRIHLSLR